MAPETATLVYNVFGEVYQQHLVLVAVDEAHCISDWSVDMDSYLLPYCSYL